MWSLFLSYCALAVLFLVVPGYLFLLPSKLEPIERAICAPLFSILTLFLSAIVFAFANLQTNWLIIYLLSCGIALAPQAVSFTANRIVGNAVNNSQCSSPIKRSASDNPSLSPEYNIRFILINLTASALIGGFVYIMTLDTPLSVFQENDCYYHLNLVRYYLDTGVFIDLTKLGYPQGWHVVTALIADTYGEFATVALNATNFILSSIVFPLGMYLWLSSIFNNQRIVKWGAIASLAFTAFPWGLLFFGPLYPNMASLAVLPSASFLFMRCFTATNQPKDTIHYILLFVTACIALAIIHPGAIFAGIALLAPFGAYKIYANCSKGARLGTKIKPLVAAGSFLAFVIIVWALFFYAPPLAGTVWFEWPAYLSKSQAIANVFSLALTKASAPQIMLSILLFIGFATSLYVNQYRWIAVSFGALASMLVVNMSSDGWLKHFLTGFWYTDEFRVAAVVAIAGIPLVCLGVHVISTGFSRLADMFFSSNKSRSNHIITSGLIATVFLLTVFAPNHNVAMNQYNTTGFGQARAMLSAGNSLQHSANAYDMDEYAFIEKIKQLVPEDAVIINVPYDGSIYSYGFNGLSVHFNAWYGYDGSDSSTNDCLIRHKLNQISYNGDVQEAVKETGASYVLLLENDYENGNGLYTAPYNPDEWMGITSITDQTPGFRLVYREGDMSLYRIEY